MDDKLPSEAPESTSSEVTLPESTQLVLLQEAAQAAADQPDLRERVRELTEKALNERRLSFSELREIIGAITTGVGSGLNARGGEMKDGLKQAVSGLDDAVSTAAQAATYTLQEAADQGRSFKENELKAHLEQLRDLETQIVDTLKETASQSGGKLKEELNALSEHLKHTGTRTGEQVRVALQQLATGVKSTTQAGRAGLSESATTAGERLAQVASGVLAALSESLKRQSERLRS